MKTTGRVFIACAVLVTGSCNAAATEEGDRATVAVVHHVVQRFETKSGVASGESRTVVVRPHTMGSKPAELPAALLDSIRVAGAAVENADALSDSNALFTLLAVNEARGGKWIVRGEIFYPGPRGAYSDDLEWEVSCNRHRCNIVKESELRHADYDPAPRPDSVGKSPRDSG